MDHLARRALLVGGVSGGLTLAAGPSREATAQVALQPPSAVNVKDPGLGTRPGARGDGATDDTDAIQGAIDEAAYVGAPSLNLYFPPGRYRVTRPIDLRTGNHLFGMVPGGDLFAGGTPYAEIVGTEVTSGPVLRNVDRLAGNDAIVLRNLRVTGPPVGSSPYATLQLGAYGGCHNLLVEGCTFWRGGAGAVDWFRVSTSWFLRNWIGGNSPVGPFGLRLNESPDNHVGANQMTTGSLPGSLGPAGDVLVVVSSEHNVIQGNFVFYGDRGIVLDGGRHVVQGNRIDTNWREGIVVRGGGHSISGNVVHTNGRAARGTLMGIVLDPGAHHTKVVANATETDNGAESFAPCQVPGIRNRSGRSDNEIGFSGPVWTG